MHFEMHTQTWFTQCNCSSTCNFKPHTSNDDGSGSTEKKPTTQLQVHCLSASAQRITVICLSQPWSSVQQHHQSYNRFVHDVRRGRCTCAHRPNCIPTGFRLANFAVIRFMHFKHNVDEAQWPLWPGVSSSSSCTMPHRRRRSRVLCASKVLFSIARVEQRWLSTCSKEPRLTVGFERGGLDSDADGPRPKSRFFI